MDNLDNIQKLGSEDLVIVSSLPTKKKKKRKSSKNREKKSEQKVEIHKETSKDETLLVEGCDIEKEKHSTGETDKLIEKLDKQTTMPSTELTPVSGELDADYQTKEGIKSESSIIQEPLVTMDTEDTAGNTITEDSFYVKPTTVGKQDSELFLQTDNVEDSKNSFREKRNHSMNQLTEPSKREPKIAPPSRSLSFPFHHRVHDSSAATKWTTIKHAVNIASNFKSQNKKSKQDSFMQRFNTNRRSHSSGSETDESGYDNSSSCAEAKVKRSSLQWRQRCSNSMVFHPDGTFMFYWLMVLSLTVEYNLWILILRQAFTPIQENSSALWYVLDGIADLIYIIDILVQFRTGFLKDGLLVTQRLSLTKHYVKSKYFVMDLISVLPLDFLQLSVGINPLLRFPRYIKVYRLIQFLYLAENQAAFPNVLRVCNLTHILLLLCHWFAAFYYMISKAEGLSGTWPVNSTNETTFSETTRIYLKSLYWSTLTLTTIGDLPSPETNWQYLFQILSYLIGVFVFATIVGQVGNSINNYNATRHEYEQLLDGAKLYMRKHEVPKDMQVRVQRWCDYAWTRGRMQGALDINSLKMLPDRLKTELALHVHLDILKQVSIFEDCEPEFLHDLVLKMHTYIFTPGDMVVRKGEIAREMFIIADGLLEVIGGKGKIIAKLSTGNFFGEIGILNLESGINRRTADVKSVGYSELFVLKREDIVRAIKYYPTAKRSLMKHANMRLAEMKEHSLERLDSVPDQQSQVTATIISEDEKSTDCVDESNAPLQSISGPSHSTHAQGSTCVIKSELDDTEGFTGNKLSELTDKIKGKEAEIVQLKEELSALKLQLQSSESTS